MFPTVMDRHIIIFVFVWGILCPAVVAFPSGLPIRFAEIRKSSTFILCTIFIIAFILVIASAVVCRFIEIDCSRGPPLPNPSQSYQPRPCIIMMPPSIYLAGQPGAIAGNNMRYWGRPNFIATSAHPQQQPPRPSSAPVVPKEEPPPEYMPPPPYSEVA